MIPGASTKPIFCCREIIMMEMRIRNILQKQEIPYKVLCLKNHSLNLNIDEFEHLHK